MRTIAVFSIARTVHRAAAVESGIVIRAMISGRANQRSRTVALIHGVAIEIRTMPATIGGQASLAQPIAFSCSAPSLFITSQQAPIST